jgi:prevent-host-death family protein
MEINAGRDIKPISDFRKESAKVLKQLKETRKPVLLTQHGRSVAVLIDVQEYESREYDRRFAAAIAEGLSDLAKGDVHSHRKVAQEIKSLLQTP